MPVLLAPDEFERWLRGSIQDVIGFQFARRSRPSGQWSSTRSIAGKTTGYRQAYSRRWPCSDLTIWITKATMQSDLFTSPILPGLESQADFVGTDEERAFIALIDAAPLAPFRFQGWLGKRLTHSFGWRYDFDNGAFAATDPIPGWLLPIKARAAAFAGLQDDDLVQALIIRYDPGAGIGWHRDRPVFEHVVGISLGSAAAMRFRQRQDGGFARASAPLGPRSIYHLSSEARHAWEHSITEMEMTRWSITFRSLSAKGRAMLDMKG